jgi:hypothetical protein
MRLGAFIDTFLTVGAVILLGVVWSCARALNSCASPGGDRQSTRDLWQQNGSA